MLTVECLAFMVATLNGSIQRRVVVKGLRLQLNQVRAARDRGRPLAPRKLRSDVVMLQGLPTAHH